MSYITNLAKALYKDKFFQRAVCSISSTCSGSGGGDVTSVFGRTGAVTAQSGDYTFTQIGSKPTTILGYGITDALSTGMLNQPNGVATLDGGGKIPASQLPNVVMTLEGEWNASTNTPVLQDGVGDPGMIYEVTTAGTQNLGSGNITFAVGDWVVYGADGLWYKSLNSNEVTSVFGRTGTVIAQTGDYTFAQIGSKPTTVSGYGITDAVKAGPADYAGALNIGTSTNNAVTVTVNNSLVATFTIVGIRSSAGITHSTNLNYGGLTFSSGSPTISRNLADSTTTFIVDNLHASNTGNIAEFKKTGTTVATIDNNGNIIAPNIQSANSVESTSLTLSTPGYYTNTGSAVTYTLPAPSGRTRTKYTIINMGSGSITIAGGFEDIWDAGTLYTSISVGAGEVVTLYNNGSKWVVI